LPEECDARIASIVNVISDEPLGRHASPRLAPTIERRNARAGLPA
jgi:hypothetical protein